MSTLWQGTQNNFGINVSPNLPFTHTAYISMFSSLPRAYMNLSIIFKMYQTVNFVKLKQYLNIIIVVTGTVY